MPERVGRRWKGSILLVHMAAGEDMGGGEGCRSINSVEEEDAVGGGNEEDAAKRS